MFQKTNQIEDILGCGDVRQKPRFQKTNQIEDIGAVSKYKPLLPLI